MKIDHDGPIACADLARMSGDITKTIKERGALWHLHPVAIKPSILAFDVGKHAAAALVSVKEVSTWRFTTTQGVSERFVAEVQSVMTGVHARVTQEQQSTLLVVVEDSFFGKNVRTVQALGEYIGAIIAIATLQHLPVVRINPQTWHAKMIGSSSKVGREQGKELSVLTASRLLKRHENTLTEHEADAYLMGKFYRGIGG